MVLAPATMQAGKYVHGRGKESMWLPAMLIPASMFFNTGMGLLTGFPPTKWYHS